MISMFQRMVMNTPEEFFQWDDIDFDLGDEYVVDNKPEQEYYPGAEVKLVEDSIYLIRIPIKRRPSVYAYYADIIDRDIEGLSSQVKDAEQMRALYTILGQAIFEGGTDNAGEKDEEGARPGDTDGPEPGAAIGGG